MKYSIPLFVVLIIASMMVMPTLVTAQTVFLATDDAYVRGGSLGNNNYNLVWTLPGDALRVRGLAVSDTNWRKSYIRFDITSYTGVVGSAKLQIWLDRAVNSLAGMLTDTTEVFTVTNDNWNENTLTWNNAPAQGQYLATQVFRRRATADPDTMYEWDVTNFVRAEFAGNKLVSFLLADTIVGNHTDLRIYSRETAGFEPALVISPTTGVQGGGSAPERFALKQNYPNPFNPSSNIEYAIATEQQVRLDLYDVLGRTVATLVNEKKSPGVYSARVQAASIGSGVYFYTLTAGSFRETKRMVVLK